MNNEKKKIGIFTWHDIGAAYACLFYLKSILGKEYEVDLWGFSNTNDIQEKDRFHYCSFKETWYGKIRRIRVYLAKLHVALVANKYDLLIINDLDFFRIGFIIRKMFPTKKIVHYNTEIHGKDVKYPRGVVRFYEKHANYPDIIIDCLAERAEYRKKAFGIEKNVFVINNTLPYKEVTIALEKNFDVEEYLRFEKTGIPTIIYAGGCNLNRGLGEIIDCVPAFDGRANFIFFCYGTKANYNMVKKKCAHIKNCHLYEAVDRQKLFCIMSHCDIGIQYYDPDVSMNHYLASPSKLYEYLALGLNVISTNNHGVDRIINSYDLGVCFTKEEGIKGGIERLLKKGLNNKEYIVDTFKKQLSYEKDSIDAIEAISQMIERT